MVRTKLTIRNDYNGVIFRASQAPGAENRPPPRIEDKNILNRRVRNQTIKTKRILPQFKKIQVKKNQVNVHSSGKRPVEY